MTASPKWTRTNRKRLHGFRAPHRLDPPDVAPSGSDSWSALVAEGRRIQASPNLSVLTEGEESAAALSIIQSQINSGERPEQLDPALEPYRIVVAALEDLTANGDSNKRHRKWDAWAPYRLLVGFWASYGIDCAIRSICAPIPFKSTGHSSHGPDGVRSAIKLTSLKPDASAVHHGFSFLRHEPLWWALRCHLSLASEEEFEAALNAARPLYAALKDSSDPNASSNACSMAFAFSRDGTWLMERARRYAGGDPVAHPLRLIAGMTDPELALACIERTRNWRIVAYNASMYSFDMIESLGPAGAEAVLKRICNGKDVKADGKKALQSAIKLAVAAQQ